jgi:hypothetical protein
MSNKFLGTTSAADLTNGSINIVGNTLSAANLVPSKALKTDALGRLYSTNLQTSDIDGYAGTNWNRVTGAIGGDYVATDNVRSVNGATTMIAHNKLQYANTETISDDKDLASKKYVDDSISVENLWDRTGTDLKPYFTGDGIQVNDIASETSGNIAIADDVNMASTKQLKFPAENQDKIDIDTNLDGVVLIN